MTGQLALILLSYLSTESQQQGTEYHTMDQDG